MNNDPIDPPADGADRDGFSRTVVHDMRNAVAPIRNAVQLLRFRAGADADLAKVTDIIERQVNEIVRLLKVVSDSDLSAHSSSALPAADRQPGSFPPAATGRRVLIADDNADLLTSLSGVLREAGHEVRTAADGTQAVALAQSWQPDFVMLDVHMPHMNGFEAAKELRALYPSSVMKLVLMSGSTLDETTMRGAQRAGFDHCLDKVHDFAELEKLLRSDG